MNAVLAWIGETRRCYLGNAFATRELRSTLRGNKAILLWTIYLLLLITVAMITYSQAASGGIFVEPGMSRSSGVSLSQAQSVLQTFYQSIVTMLLIVVCVIAPAATAGSLVLERQRKSLDLVLTSPISVRYMFIGKLISSYRYLWLLLILSLPVVSLAVVLGSATAAQVFQTYYHLSLTGLVFTSLGLLVSSMSETPVKAVVFSYIVCGTYAFLTATLGATSAFGGMTGLNKDQMMGLTLITTPIHSSGLLGASSWGIPNLLGYTVLVLLVVVTCTTCATAALSPVGHGSIVRARLLGIGWATFTASQFVFTLMPGFGGRSDALLCYLIWVFSILTFASPISVNITCYNRFETRKYQNDGYLSIRKILTGHRSGGLAYMLLVLLIFLAPLALFAKAITAQVVIGTVYLIALVVLYWALGRFASSRSRTVSQARTVHFLLGLMLAVVPLMMGTLAGWDSASSISPLAPFFNDPNGNGGLVPLIVALILIPTLLFMERHNSDETANAIA